MGSLTLLKPGSRAPRTSSGNQYISLAPLYEIIDKYVSTSCRTLTKKVHTPGLTKPPDLMISGSLNLSLSALFYL